MRFRNVALPVLAFGCVITLTRPIAAQSGAGSRDRHEIIRGRVTTDSGSPIAGADIVVTMAPTAETFVRVTNAAGEYDVSIAIGSGEYLLYVGALGRQPYRRRVTRAGPDTIYVVDVKLEPVAVRTTAVRVLAKRVRPTPSAGVSGAAGTNGTDKTVDGVASALPPELAGNIEAMASLAPGLAVTPAGISAFGLSSDNNQVSLNGLAFAGTDLPRDARTTTRFSLSPWDPAAGGFAGALVTVAMLPGDNVSQRHGHVTFDAPMFQFSDPLAGRTGQKFSRLDVSEGGSGPLVLDKYFYDYGAQVSRSASTVSSLLALDPDVLTHAGLSPDSVSRLLQILRSNHVPVSSRGVPDGHVTTTATFMERVDYAPSPTITGRDPRRLWSVTGYGRFAQTAGASLSPTVTPAYAGTNSAATGAIQGILTAYLGRDERVLNETTSGVSVSGTRGTPYTRVPSGDVSIVSQFADGTTGIGSAGFGGNALLASSMTSWTWETVNQTTVLPTGHASVPLHLYLQSRYTGYRQAVSANRDGRFDFASLADLAAARATSYSRTLSAPERDGGEWVGAAAVGGSWTTAHVVWTGGLRADANAFTAAPRLNPAVLTAFGKRTNHAPNGVGLSPRLGFNWYYSGARPGAVGSLSGGAVSLFRGASQIRGGVGEFRSAPVPTLLSTATGATGLDDATQQIRCVGNAVPLPDWQAYQRNAGSIPAECADGASAFVDGARTVMLFDPSFTAPRTWKGTLGWTTWNDYVYLAVDGAYALNLRQPGTIDLNFTGSPWFALPDESNRPVFAPASAIVPTTGSVSGSSSRRTAGFGSVADRVSDLRSDARQLTVYAIPGIPLQHGTLSLSYTYMDARAQARGFDQAAAGDPRVVEWAAASVPRHQLVAQLYHYFLKTDLAVTASVRTASGLPFTPVVAGDLNGDGIAGDRAFVFDPARTADPTLAHAMLQLLSAGAGPARDCLRRQLGRLAGRNSCVAPWSSTMNAGFYFGRALPGAHRARFSMSLFNVLAGVDEGLHGTSRLHGWGAAPVPDPVLARVRGFDATAHRFLYDVNQRFGSASPGTTTLRAPFRINMDVSIDLGRSPAAQRLEQNLRLRPGLVGTRAPADTVRKRYLAGFTDIYAALLRLADSLALSRDQIERIQLRRVSLDARADTIYTGLTTYLSGLPAHYDGEAAVGRVTEATEAAWQVIYDEVPFLKSVLTPGQIRRLPSGMKMMVTIPNWRGRFFFRD